MGILDDMQSILSDVDTDGFVLDTLDSFPSQKNIFDTEPRKAWDCSVEARCDFTRKVRLSKRADTFFISLWQKSLYGRTLSDIKSDASMIPFFAENISSLIVEFLGRDLGKGDWAICTTPKRRHKTNNFASLISENIAKSLGIPFYDDVAFCNSRQRIDAVFSLNILPNEQNIIVFDDFVTTGSTLKAMKELLMKYHKTLIFATAINNKLG